MQIVPIARGMEVRLANFFVEIRRAGDDIYFHPHPLTPCFAISLVYSHKQDFYCVGVENGDVIAYGMLRGWDEGYIIPSLGIAVSPKHRGTGKARQIVLALHDEARSRGASKVRLTVFNSNTRARVLYQQLGYVFTKQDSNTLLGFVNLGRND
jgi:ribosomal protein S18 acetylase RimI-like enzyme